MCIRVPTGIVLLVLSSLGTGATFHEFCVTRIIGAGSETLRARLHFNGADPGEETAALLLIRHYRQPGVDVVHVDAPGPTCAARDAQEIALGKTGTPTATAIHPGGFSDIAKATNQAYSTLNTAATEASRMMCRVLPC